MRVRLKTPRNDGRNEKNDDFWLSCSGKLKHLLSTINLLTHPGAQNIEEFPISAKEYANYIKTQCNGLEKSAERLEVKIDRQKRSVQPGDTMALIEHDPGKRNTDLSDSQLHFLLNIFEYWQNQTRMRPYQVTYMSKDTENELIKLLGDAVSHRIVKKLEEVSAFSVMADTTPDSSNKDQISIVVRYFINAKPVWRLLWTRILKDKCGECLAVEI